MSSKWVCGVCTLENAARRRRCQACETRRPVESETARAAPTAVALAASPPLDSKQPSAGASSSPPPEINAASAANESRSTSNKTSKKRKKRNSKVAKKAPILATNSKRKRKQDSKKRTVSVKVLLNLGSSSSDADEAEFFRQPLHAILPSSNSMDSSHEQDTETKEATAKNNKTTRMQQEGEKETPDNKTRNVNVKLILGEASLSDEHDEGWLQEPLSAIIPAHISSDPVSAIATHHTTATATTRDSSATKELTSSIKSCKEIDIPEMIKTGDKTALANSPETSNKEQQESKKFPSSDDDAQYETTKETETEHPSKLVDLNSDDPTRSPELSLETTKSCQCNSPKVSAASTVATNNLDLKKNNSFSNETEEADDAKITCQNSSHNDPSSRTMSPAKKSEGMPPPPQANSSESTDDGSSKQSSPDVSSNASSPIAPMESTSPVITDIESTVAVQQANNPSGALTPIVSSPASTSAETTPEMATGGPRAEHQEENPNIHSRQSQPIESSITCTATDTENIPPGQFLPAISKDKGDSTSTDDVEPPTKSHDSTNNSEETEAVEADLGKGSNDSPLPSEEQPDSSEPNGIIRTDNETTLEEFHQFLSQIPEESVDDKDSGVQRSAVCPESEDAEQASTSLRQECESYHEDLSACLSSTPMTSNSPSKESKATIEGSSSPFTPASTERENAASTPPMPAEGNQIIDDVRQWPMLSQEEAGEGSNPSFMYTPPASQEGDNNNATEEICQSSSDPHTSLSRPNEAACTLQLNDVTDNISHSELEQEATATSQADNNDHVDATLDNVERTGDQLYPNTTKARLDNKSSARSTCSESNISKEDNLSQPPCFKSAGRQVPIHVSKTELLRAENFLPRPHTNTNTNKTSTVSTGFQNAGTGAAVLVSSEALAKANGLLRGTKQNCDGFLERAETPVAGGTDDQEHSCIFAEDPNCTTAFEMAGKENPEDATKSEPEQNSSVQPSNAQKYATTKVNAVPKSFGGFQTAGKSKHIIVSEGALQRAGMLFKEISNSSNTGGLSYAPNHNTATASLKPSGSGDRRSSGASLQSTSTEQGPKSFVGFQTAGKSKHIAVSKEALQRAGQLLQRVGSDGPLPDRGSLCEPNQLDAAGSQTKLTSFGQEGSGWESLQSTSSDKQPQACRGFHTAGLSKKITVSEEALQRAGKLFQGIGNDDKGLASDTGGFSHAPNLDDPTALLKPAGLGPKRSLGGSFRSTSTDEPPKPFGGFQAAGLSKKIMFSEEALQIRAGKPFQGFGKDNKGLASDTGGFSYSSNHNAAAASLKSDRSDKEGSVRESLQSTCTDEQPKSFVSFQTAGKSKNIPVSKEALQRAGQLFQGASKDDRGIKTGGFSYTHNYNATTGSLQPAEFGQGNYSGKSLQSTSASKGQQPQSFGGFQTAGTSKSIAVAEDALQRAGQLFQIMGKDAKGLASDTGGFAYAPNHKAASGLLKSAGFSPGRSNGTSLQCANTKQQPKSFGGFQTAGKSKHIAVSGEALQRAGQFLQRMGKDDESVGTGGFSAAPNHYTATALLKSTSLPAKFGQGKSSGASLQSTSRGQPPISFGRFQTAGTSKSIAVSEEALRRAGQIFQGTSKDDKGSETGGFSYAPDNNATTASLESAKFCQGKSRKESLQSASTSRGQRPQSFGGFQTAGTSKSIAVSEEALQRAGHLFQGTSKDDEGLYTAGFSCAPNHNATTSSLKPAEFGQGKCSGASLQSTSRDEPPKAFGGFQTAGKSKSIVVSKEALQRAGQLFQGTSKDDKGLETGGFYYAPKHNATTASLEPAKFGQGKSSGASLQSTSRDEPPKAFGGFQTAGKSKSIVVSKEALQRAGQLFQGTSKDDNVLETRSFSCAPNNNAATALKPDEQNVSTSYLPDDSSTVSRQPPRRRRPARVSDVGCQNANRVLLDLQKGPECEEDEPYSSEDEMRFAGKGSTYCSSSHGQNGSDGLHYDGFFCEANDNGETPSFDRAKVASVTMSAGFRKQQHPDETAQVGRSCGESLSPLPLCFDRFENQSEQCVSLRQKIARLVHSTVQVDPCDPCKDPLEWLNTALKSKTMSKDLAQCRGDGVLDTTLEVDSVNAANLVFRVDGDSSSPHSFCPVEENPSLVGLPNDLVDALVERGCKKDYIIEKWLQNHKRWIVWKLAALERRFSFLFGGILLTYEVFIEQLHHRYRKEYQEGQRSALKTILNKDIAASRMMIVCVCQIYDQSRKKKSGSNAEGDTKSNANDIKYTLEVTDGWYSILVAPDQKICEFIDKGRVVVGTKLMVSGAFLVGGDDGIDPLDDTNSPSDQKQCKVFMRISANSTRVAKWDAKLGFVPSCQQLQNDSGLLRVKRIADVLPGGGSVPLINLMVCRKYPLMFLHRLGEGQESEMITEAEEYRQRADFERRKLKLTERFTEEVEQECTEDVDEMAPPIWNRLATSQSPEDFYSSLNYDDKKAIERWREKRGSMLQTRIQQEVQAKIEDEPSLIRESTPFLRILVKSYDRSLLRKPPTPKDEAILTVWSPSEEQCGFLREGAALRFENLSTRKYESRLQLSANGRTLIAPCSHLPHLPLEAIHDSLFSHRKYSSVFLIHAVSRKLLQSKDKGDRNTSPTDYDFVGVILKVVENEEEHQLSIYVTDKSKLVARVQCGRSTGIGDSIGLRSPISRQCVEHPRVIAFRDLVVRPFDKVENCAVLEFKAVSSVRSQNLEPMIEKVRQWAESTQGRGCLQGLAAHLDAGLFTFQRPLAVFVPVLGYIAGFMVQPPNQLRILVDSGSQNLQEFAFPFRLLRDVVLPESSNEMVSLNSDEEGLCSKLKIMGKFFRARGVLYRFMLKRTAQSITSFRPCEFEVCQIIAADMDAVCAVYLSIDLPLVT